MKSVLMIGVILLPLASSAADTTLTPEQIKQLDESCDRVRHGAKVKDELKAPLFDPLRDRKIDQTLELGADADFYYGRWVECAGASASAMLLYENAAKQGHLGAMKLLSESAVADKFHWLGKAAEAGDEESQYEYARQIEELSRGQIYDLYRVSQMTRSYPIHSMNQAERDAEIQADILKWYKAAAAQPGPEHDHAIAAVTRVTAAMDKATAEKAEKEAAVQAALKAEQQAQRFKNLVPAALGILAVLIAAIAGFLVYRKRSAIAARFAVTQRRWALRRQIKRRVDERWPEHLFPRIPKRIFKFVDNGSHPDLDDGRWEDWSELLTLFPEPPHNDAERQKAEAAFWRERMHSALDRASDEPVLLPKQAIMDWWWAWERYTWKRYYAATGLHHSSVYSARWLENEETLYKFRRVRSFDTTNPKQRANLQRFESADREIRDFWDREVPAHRERWGEWFFANIERAFREEFGPPPDVEGQNVHGDARLTTEEEVVPAAKTGANRRSPVHEQEF